MSLSIERSLLSIFSGGKIRKNLSNNLISQGSIFTGKWIFNFALAKLLPPALFGIFTLVQALGNFLMNVFSFGASAHLIHSISKDKSSAFRKLKTSQSLTAKLILIAVLFYTILWLLPYEIAHFDYMIWSIALGGILSFNVQTFAFFKGLGKFQKESQAAILFSVCSFAVACSFWIFIIIENLHVLLGLFFALQCLIFIKGHIFLSKWLRELNEGLYPQKGDFLKERIPFGLHEIQGAIYIHVILLILGFMVPAEDLGIYRAVQLFITPVSLLPGVVSQVTLNRLSSLSGQPKMQIAVFRKFLKFVSLSGFMFFLGYLLFGEAIISWIYDYKYDTILVNELIICFSAAFMLRFISSNYGVFITSAGKQSVRVIMTFLSILVSVFLTYFLTSFYGVKGAAISGVASFGVITLGYGMYCELYLFKKLKQDVSNDLRS